LQPIRKTNFVQASYKGHKEVLYDIYTNLVPFTKGIIIDDKYYAKKFLSSKGFKVNTGEIFDGDYKKTALTYAREIGFPVVVKPTISSHGENVIMDINSVRDLKIAIVTFLSKYNQSAYFLIEKQFEAKEYRIFVTQSGFIAAVERTPANITGDGKSTIRKLIKVENYRRMNPRNTCLCKIAIDDISKNHLKKQGLSFSATPTKGQKVFLRKNSNVSTGGNCYDVTDSMHLSYKKLAKAILNALNVPFVGIDLLCSDISKNMDDYKVCELNSAPGLSLHMMPEKGKSRDVANAIVDVIFPPVI